MSDQLYMLGERAFSVTKSQVEELAQLHSNTVYENMDAMPSAQAEALGVMAVLKRIGVEVRDDE